MSTWQKLSSSFFFKTLVVLWGLGSLQVLSSSFSLSLEYHQIGYYYFIKQLAFVLLAFTVLLLSLKDFVPRQFVHLWWIWPLSALAALMTLLPGIGAKAGGASRWLSLPLGLRLEPSEFLKLGFCFWLPALFYLRPKTIESWGLKAKWFLTLIPLIVLLLQPDFGSLVMLCLLFVIFLFINGLSWRVLVALAVPLMAGLALTLWLAPYRRQRLLAFLDPWSDPMGRGYQVLQSMLTVSRGGLWGQGIGRSSAKWFYLPEGHTDFTFAVWLEEWGFIAGLLLLLFWGYVIYRMAILVSQQESRYQRSVLAMLMSLFGLATFLNLAVVTGLLPTKGLSLPFFSYGGSNLVAMSFVFIYFLHVEMKTFSTEARS